MNRWTNVLICVLCGAMALACGLLVPIHLRSVDTSVIQKAGRGTPTLVDCGLALVKETQLGGAQTVLKVAEQQGLPDTEALTLTMANLARQSPGALVWGVNEPTLQALFPTATSEPFTEFVIRQENRKKLLELLETSQRVGVQEMLRCRGLTHTILFAPSSSSAGQAIDAALCTAALLIETKRVSPTLGEAVFALATKANQGGNSQYLEQVLIDLVSLGQRMNWGQLTAFLGRIDDTETLRLLAAKVRADEKQLPMIFTAVQLSGNPSGVAKYLVNFSQSGMSDLGVSLRFGAGGLRELLLRNQRLHEARFGLELASDSAWHVPGLALTLKWLLYLGSGFFLAAAMHYARPAVPAMERPLQVRGFHIAREILFALGFLLVVLLLSEPFLAQESQKVDIPFRLHLPTVGSVVPVGTTNTHPSLMNLSLLTLLLFFVLQALIYTACVVKLAEIRRQKISTRLKLKLLENEEHLFDSGLYLGFAGTIISLILVSLQVIQPSLMAAYSSTSFGIIFVSVFKIFNLRPARRTMLLEIEGAQTAATTTQVS